MKFHHFIISSFWKERNFIIPSFHHSERERNFIISSFSDAMQVVQNKFESPKCFILSYFHENSKGYYLYKFHKICLFSAFSFNFNMRNLKHAHIRCNWTRGSLQKTNILHFLPLMTDINKAFAVGFKQAFDKRFFSYCNNSTLSTRKSGFMLKCPAGGEHLRKFLLISARNICVYSRNVSEVRSESSRYCTE